MLKKLTLKKLLTNIGIDTKKDNSDVLIFLIIKLPVSRSLNFIKVKLIEKENRNPIL